MKRIIYLLVIIYVCAAFAACGTTGEEPARDAAAVQTASQTQAAAEPTAAPEPVIAVLLGAHNAYTDAFAAAVTPAIEAGGYRASLYHSANADAQVNDLYSAIGEGAKAAAVWPVDMDNMQGILDDMDLQKIPVVNLMVPVNGIVRTLVSPDYQSMGEQAAQAAGRARPDGASVLTVEMQDSAFITQMIHDGFARGDRGEELVSLDASVLAGGAEDAYAKAKAALDADSALNVVFVADEYVAPDVLRAVQETGRDITVIAAGGGGEMIGLIQNGSVYASVFSSPHQLARLTGGYLVDAANGNAADIPQYAQLFLETIDAQNVSGYTANGGYADILDDTPAPAAAQDEQPQDPDAAAVDGQDRSGTEQEEETSNGDEPE